MQDRSARSARSAWAVVRLASALNPARRGEFSAELHALQRVERVAGFDYAMGTLLSAASERATQEIRRTLVISSISKSYGHTNALSNITLRVDPGSVVALMGSNGAGKTTLLRMLAGEEAVHRGRISFGNSAVGAEIPAALGVGGPLASDSQSARRRFPPGMTVVRPKDGLIEHFSVAENIAFGRSRGWLVHRKVELSIAKTALQQVRSAIDPSRLATSLSPAERIQVLLAREVSNGSAELVILDEPTATMSANEAESVFDSIAALQEHRRGVIFVSHRIDQVFRVADRVAVLCDGRLVLDKTIAATNAAEVLNVMNGIVGADSATGEAGLDRAPAPPRVMMLDRLAPPLSTAT